MATSACPVATAVLDWARTTPHNPAVVGASGPRSYAWLAQEAERWRAAVSAHDIAPRSAVALVGDLDEHLVAAWLGIRGAGHVPGMVDVGAEPQWQAEVLESMRPALAAHTGESERVERHSPPVAPASLPAGVGYLSFSSGSQGRPKVILGSASGLAAFLDWERDLLGLATGSTTAALTSPSFDVVLRDLFLPLTSGFSVHTANRSVRWSVGRVVPWLAEAGAVAVHVVPSVSLRWSSRATQVLADLEWTVFAGEPLHAKHARAWRGVAPSSRMANLYGPTETTLAA
ncbi:MAG: AMP-binding protein, partial [Phycicoccus sp.]